MKLTLQDKLEAEKIRFENYLNKRGVKFSVGRQCVFHIVMNAHGHFTAEELVKHCRRKKKKVSRATIYRSLRELLEAGVIRETAFGEKHQYYEHVYDEKLHHHARCIHCHQVCEFPCQKEDSLFKSNLTQSGFHVLGHEVHFYGICSKCQNKEAS